MDSYEAAHNDPRLRQALLQQQSAAEQQQLAVALAKTASQEAAVEALRKQEAEASQLAKHVVLKMSDAQAMALEQLRECQERLNTTLDAYVTEVERARQERGQCLAETEKQAMMLCKFGKETGTSHVAPHLPISANTSCRRGAGDSQEDPEAQRGDEGD